MLQFVARAKSEPCYKIAEMLQFGRVLQVVRLLRGLLFQIREENTK